MTGAAPASTPPAPGAGADIALRCQGLVKRYGDVTAVDRLDLDVRRGECFGLLGPNGAGKTTTIEILEGLLPADEGTVDVLGLRWGRDDRQLRERLGIQLQETQFSDKLTVAEITRLFRSFYARGRSVDEILALVGLETKRDARYVALSGGQKQRLAVACALVGAPDVLFLDEPTTGLDPQSRRQLWSLLEGYRAGGGTILLTTHYMDEAEALCDRVAVVDKGKVIALGTPRELIRSLGAEHVVEFAMVDGEPLPDPDAVAPAARRPRRAPAGHDLRAGRLGDPPGDPGAARPARRATDEAGLPDDAQRDARRRLHAPHRTAPARCLSRA